MKKRIIISLSAILIILATINLSSCKCKKNQTQANSTSNYVEGTVKKLPDLIGQCAWVIELKDGTRLEPRELKEEYFIDGKKIVFEFEELKDLKSKCMTGKIVKIINVR